MVGAVHLHCSDTDLPRATLEDSEATPVIYWGRYLPAFTASETMKSDVKVKQRLFQVCKDPNILLPFIHFPWITAGCSPVKQKCKNTGRPDPGGKVPTPELGWRKDGTGTGTSWAEGCKWGYIHTGAEGQSTPKGRSQEEQQRQQNPAKERNRWITRCVWKLTSVDIWKSVGAFGKKDGCIETKASNGKWLLP